jgi:hypothetical protein
MLREKSVFTLSFRWKRGTNDEKSVCFLRSKSLILRFITPVTSILFLVSCLTKSPDSYRDSQLLPTSVFRLRSLNTTKYAEFHGGFREVRNSKPRTTNSKLPTHFSLFPRSFYLLPFSFYLLPFTSLPI